MINRILRMFMVRRKPEIGQRNEDLLLNYALELAQEWGDYWLKPIQERLGLAYPNLSNEELDRLNIVAQSAMKFCHDLAYSMAESQGENIDKASWQAAVLARYPWVDQRNLSHLFSTGMYYAYKDGVGR